MEESEKRHSVEVQKINNEKVKPVKLPDEQTLPTKGRKLFDNCYSNIFICAKKKSGKTVLIHKILKDCIDRDTRIVFICSTIHKDSTYKYMIEKFGKRHSVETYESLTENKESIIDRVLNYTDASEVEETPPPPPPPVPGMRFSDIDILPMIPEEPKKQKKEKKRLAPEIVIVLDDLGQGLRIPSVGDLLKKNRHYKSKVIISSQYPNDLTPQALKQLDYCILFKGHSEDKLKLIHKHLDLAVPIEIFIQMYKTAVKEKYSFFYIDPINVEFRINFNTRIKLPDSM